MLRTSALGQFAPLAAIVVVQLLVILLVPSTGKQQADSLNSAYGAPGVPGAPGTTSTADAVRRVADGDAVFSPRLAGFVLDAFKGGTTAEADEELDLLTAREREVMRLIARGYAYKEVAKELFISGKTVETHVSSVLRKLQLSNRHELARWASARRLV